MKRILILMFIVILPLCLTLNASAAESELFGNEVERLENSLNNDVSEDLKELGISGLGDVSKGLKEQKLFDYTAEILKRYSGGVLSSLMMLICIVITASIAESYTYSLRYTHTKDIMNTAVSLMTASAVITPVAKLSADSSAVIGSSASIMLVYLPVMAGILAFSGRAIASAGYYASTVTGASLISKLASALLAPLLNVFLSLAICSGINSRIKLSGLVEAVSKIFKWTLTFSVSMFTAVTGLNAVLSTAGDSLTSRASKFALSSFIPLIGSAVADAYHTLQGSLGLLRSGMGVFVIIAVMVSFCPVILRALLWSAALGMAKLTAEALGVTSALNIFNSISAFLSALRAVLISVMVAFIISTAVMLRVGGTG